MRAIGSVTRVRGRAGQSGSDWFIQMGLNALPYSFWTRFDRMISSGWIRGFRSIRWMLPFRLPELLLWAI
jgi:hypothetical protein